MLNKHVWLNEISLFQFFVLLPKAPIDVAFNIIFNIKNKLRTRRKASVHLEKIRSSRRHCNSTSSTSLEVKIGSQVFRYSLTKYFFLLSDLQNWWNYYNWLQLIGTDCKCLWIQKPYHLPLWYLNFNLKSSNHC